MKSRIDADFTECILRKLRFHINTKQFTSLPKFYSHRLGTLSLAVKIYFYRHQRICHVICSRRKSTVFVYGVT